MAQGDTTITVVGNLVADPELRFTPSGVAVANFRIASTPRTFNRNSNQWEDGQALFLTCNVWREAAENVAESLQKGLRVIVQGRLRQRSYETREGEQRTIFEVAVDEVGPSLKYAKAEVLRNPRGSGQGNNNFGNQNNNQRQSQQGPQSQGQAPNTGGFGQGQQSAPQQNQGSYDNGQQGIPPSGQSTNPQQDYDPWNSAPPANNGGFGGPDDEPPF